jgi:deoxyribodipyrimidine photo-lyase
MYLHFGQISPIWLVLEARRRAAAARAESDEGASDAETAHARAESVDSFIEELVVRRELAHNYVFYEENYDSYHALPPWALQTLTEHAGDERSYLYSDAELAEAATHDEYWNAATREMTYTGYMHNYMRMYWGKKILEWSPDPETAFNRALELNNRYFLDGRDPNSYANVAWIFGLHDRPWQERPIFGKVRIMKASGLKRKCDMPGYLAKVEGLTRGSHGTPHQGDLFGRRDS